MEELLVKINDLFYEFKRDSNARLDNGNKAAGARSQETSLELDKPPKEWRKIFVKE